MNEFIQLIVDFANNFDKTKEDIDKQKKLEEKLSEKKTIINKSTNNNSDIQPIRAPKSDLLMAMAKVRKM